jgi:ubiquinone/menaquinone biosynthesis C-methylase UbiE
MSNEQEDSGHRWFAAMYDLLCGRSASGLLKPVHARIMGEAEGRVLEIGAGTGLGLSIYPSTAHVVATEPDPHMLKRAYRRVEELGLTNVELHRAPAEEIPFDDDSFDHVVTSLVLCTVSDPARSLAEAKRLLKPNGTLRFVEHVRNDESRFWGAVQDLITPGWRWFGAGCNPNRRTKQSIEDAGFDIEWLEQVRIGPGTPAIYGVAKPV